MSIASANGRGRGYSVTGSRGYASKPGKKELYSDEAGGVGAGVSPFSFSDARCTQIQLLTSSLD